MVTIGSRHEYMLEAAVGTDRDGTMRAIDVTGFQNAGAYSEISEDVMETGIKNSYALFPRWMRCGSASIPCLPTSWRAVPFAASAQRRIASWLNVAARHIADELQLDLSNVFLKNIARLGDSHPVMNGLVGGCPAYIQSTTLARAPQIQGADRLG